MTAPANVGHVLTRALIEAGGVEDMVARAAPHLRQLTDAERAESLDRTLAERPPGDAWLFGYGSLIWNPTITVVERRIARVEGWHRAFCLTTHAGRGNLDSPGLVLGLDSGGHCFGVAFRIADEVLRTELSVLWRREMLAGSYVPRWLDVADLAGHRFGSALAFTVDTAGEHYAAALAREVIVTRLSTARGELGSSAEYLFSTCAGLHAEGIADPDLDALAESVAAAQAAGLANRLP